MNAAGIQLLKEFEGLAPEVSPGVYRSYWDALGKVWTGPFGFTRAVTVHSRWTLAQAEQDLLTELRDYEAAVHRACTVEPNENQFAAMVCLAWNIGIAGFQRSTVLKCHNKGEFEAAARAFAMWNKAGGHEVLGLVRRRAAEAALYLRAVDGDMGQMPQRVDPESGARHSPIIWGTGISSGAGALSLMSETSRTLGDLRYNLGEWFPYLLLAAVVAGAAWAIWSRVKQRRSGWA